MKKKKKQNNPWLFYWIGMGVVAAGILVMVIVLISNRSGRDEVALAPTQQNPPPRQLPRETLSEKKSEKADSDPAAPPVVEKTAPETKNQPVKAPDAPPPSAKNEEKTDRQTETDPAKNTSTEPGTPVVGVNVGNEIIEVEGADLQGKQFKLSDYRGKVVLLDFWGFW